MSVFQVTPISDHFKLDVRSGVQHPLDQPVQFAKVTSVGGRGESKRRKSRAQSGSEHVRLGMSERVYESLLHKGSLDVQMDEG